MSPVVSLLLLLVSVGFISGLTEELNLPVLSPIYPFPHYTEISTCPCDLTTQKCDVYCCCDKVRSITRESLKNPQPLDLKIKPKAMG